VQVPPGAALTWRPKMLRVKKAQMWAIAGFLFLFEGRGQVDLLFAGFVKS
jgi:hypothetical protein